MISRLALTTFLVAFAAAPALAQKQRPDANGNLDALISRHAAANNVPEDLVRRVIKRESGGNPLVISAGNYGLMQIKLPLRAPWETPAPPPACSMPIPT
jgi:soluble lytic murein transglycosylase-like protein